LKEILNTVWRNKLELDKENCKFINCIFLKKDRSHGKQKPFLKNLKKGMDS
jgi:hypothetical protein